MKEFVIKHRYDFLIFFLLLSLGFLIGGLAFLPVQTIEVPGVHVYRDGALISSFSLNDEGYHEIEGHDGILKIEIKEEKVAIVSSPCPSQTCVECGFIEAEEGPLICLFEGILISIEGGAENEVTIG